MKKYTLYVLFFALLVAPSLSLAVTIDVAKLNQLMSQLNILQRQLVILQNQATSTCPFYHDLALGQGGEGALRSDVVLTQNWLRASGYLNLAQSTGWFGPLTKSAIIHWQKDNNLKLTGSVGSEERQLLCGKDVSTSTTTYFIVR